MNTLALCNTVCLQVQFLVTTVAVGFASAEYTVTENDQTVELEVIKQGQVKKRVELRYVILPPHPPRGMSSDC